MRSIWTWIVAHPAEASALAVLVLSTIATGLTRYPRAGGWVYWLRWLAGLLSLLAHRGSPGLLGPLSLPGVPQRPPVQSPPGSPRPGGMVLGPLPGLLLIVMLGVGGCGGIADQVRADSEAVLSRCIPAAVIECGRCISRTVLAEECERARRRGDVLPHPDCAGLWAASRPAR